MNLTQWLSWMEQCHTAEIDLGLDRVSRVANELQLDLSSSTVVTVAGTNGKGSTVSYLSSIYLQAGYSVGAYTSPHFLRYNERVRLDGLEATDEQLCDAFERIDQARGQIPLTYFEFGTLAALIIFADTKPDLVLLEVGLGGRLDAVNIIDADVSVVTTVAIDHVDWLGDDREFIGHEKSGIFRADKPAICGDLNPPVSVAKYAADIGAELYQADQQFSFEKTKKGWHWKGLNADGSEQVINDLPLPSLPLQNASTAIQVCQHIPLNVSADQIKTGLQTARLTGRMQKLEVDGVNYWLDVAHNPEAAELLAKRIKDMPKPVTLLLGMLADKDCQQVIDLIAPVVDSIYLTDLNVPRGQKASALAALLPAGVHALQADTVKSAIEQIKKHTNAEENVIIAGSFFTVSDALSELGKEK